MISPKQKTLIQRVINVFETGTPEGRYDALVIFADGKDGSRQITYGRSQTTEQGNLRELIEMYIANNGRFAQDFSPFVDRIGVTPLTNNSAFKDLLKTAARQDSVMRETQDEFFDKRYWKPAQKWFDKNGFQEPLSMLVIYDSYIHSGSIRSFLRRRFRAVPPAKGGTDRAWISSYVDTRHQWLKHHSNPILQKTIYRTQTFLDEIERNNWKLRKLPIMANGVAVS